MMIDFSQKYMQRGYKLGDVDCFKLIYDFRQHIGLPLPDAFGEVTIGNYPDLFKDNPRRAKAVMLRYLKHNTTIIKKQYTFCGDIMYLKLNDEPPALAINAGNGQVIVANDEVGVTMSHLSKYKILMVFR